MIKRTLSENMGNIKDKSYIGEEVYLIDFPIKGTTIPNNMIKYAGLENHKLIGYSYVD